MGDQGEGGGEKNTLSYFFFCVADIIKVPKCWLLTESKLWRVRNKGFCYVIGQRTLKNFRDSKGNWVEDDIYAECPRGFCPFSYRQLLYINGQHAGKSEDQFSDPFYFPFLYGGSQYYIWIRFLDSQYKKIFHKSWLEMRGKSWFF